MPVQENPVQAWRDIKLQYKKLHYPQPRDPHLPRMFFVSLAVGSRGSGKSYSIVGLLKQYEKCGIVDPESGELTAQRIILFSPTIAGNPIFTALQHLSEDDIVSNYSDERLLEKIQDVEQERKETEKYQRLLKAYRKFLKTKSVDALDHDDLLELAKNDFEPPEPPKYPNGCCIFMVFDDLVGTDAFKSTGRSALTNLVLKNRHLRINIFIATQNLKAIPKSIRTNTSLFVIFKFASKKIILEDLYQEVSNTLTLEQFEELYEYATQEEHDCLVMDFTASKEERFKKNFKSVIRVSH